jgi:hypothetical protein
MLMKEVPTGIKLHLVELHAKLDMDHGSVVLLSNHGRVSLQLIDVLPRAEGGAHGATDQQHGFLRLDHPPCSLPILSNVKVPRVAGLIVHRQI